MAAAAVFVLAYGTDAFAQVRVSGDPVALTPSEYMNPSWSPDGSRLAVTAPRYEGIYVVDISSGDMREITSESGAGYGYSWSPDGTALLARVSRYEGPRRYNAVKVFGVDEGTENQLTEYRSSMPATPTWDANGERVLLFADEGLEVFDLAPAAEKAAPSQPQLMKGPGGLVRADASTGEIAVVDAFADREILNLVRSPDGSRVVFEVMGGNLFSVSADGTDVVDLGRGNRPAWSPDGEWVVFMMTEDDGHVITSSDLVAIRADGSQRSRVTETADLHEMNPSWSPDGSRIAFDDAATGGVFVVDVEY